MTEEAMHSEHIVSAKTYLMVGAALFVLTGLTVGVSFVDLGPFNMVVAMGIAAMKASLVVLVFMHLFYDDKLYLTIFLMGVLMLAIFIILTLFDTMRRDDIYQEVAQPLNPQAEIYEAAASDSAAAASDTTGAQVDSAATSDGAQSH